MSARIPPASQRASGAGQEASCAAMVLGMEGSQQAWRISGMFCGGSPTFVLALGGVQLPLPVPQWS